MLPKLLDWVFGIRYRATWPRGVKPLYPWIEELKTADPQWWQDHHGDTPYVALEEFVRRNPAHAISAEIASQLHH